MASSIVDIGFTVANEGSKPCVLDGYPAISLVPRSGSSTSVSGHNGQASVFGIGPAPITLSPGGLASAAFVLQYGDQQTDGDSCAETSSIDATLPDVAGAFPVPYDNCLYPPLAVSALITSSQYQAALK